MLVVVKGGLVSASLQSMGGGGSGGACLIAWAHSNPSVCQVGLAELDFGRAYQISNGTIFD